MNELAKHIFAKLSSGRWIFTVVAAVTFSYLSITGKLPPDKVMEVILVVVMAYFSRNDRKPEGGNGNA
jgi:amino acid permease